MNDLTLRVQSLGAFFDEALAAGRRLDKGGRKAAHGKLAFESMEGLLKVLTANRWTLLTALRNSGPSSIRALAKGLARDYRSVHADVALLIDAGLIARGEDAKISVPWTRIVAEMDLGAAA